MKYGAVAQVLAAAQRNRVRRVAGQQYPALTVSRGLTSHVGEPGNVAGTVDPIIGPVSLKTTSPSRISYSMRPREPPLFLAGTARLPAELYIVTADLVAATA